MPPAHRFDDLNTGHSCFSSTPVCIACETVLVNSLGATVAMSPGKTLYTTHCCGPACHDSFLREGSESVWIEGFPAGRQGDLVLCDFACYADKHSDNVNFGGAPFEFSE